MKFFLKLDSYEMNKIKEMSDLQPCQRRNHQYQLVAMLTVVIKVDHHVREERNKM